MNITFNSVALHLFGYFKGSFHRTFYILMFTLFSINSYADNIKVSLISVATEQDSFWHDLHYYAMKAAQDFDIELNIIYTNRNHLLAVEIAEKLSTSNEKPDYVIVVGEKTIASKSIPVLSKNGIKVFLLGETTDSEELLTGQPKEIYANYIGKLTLDDYMAGYQTAELIIKKSIQKGLYDVNGNINLLMLEGVAKTPFNLERVKGAKEAFKKYPQVKVIQSVPTDWTYKKAKFVTQGLLHRYNFKIAGVWCANSALARGSSRAFEIHGKYKKEDYFITGTDWDLDSVKSVVDGNILALSGGHVLSAAWILTLIHDHHNGVELGSGVFQLKNLIMDKSKAKQYLRNAYFIEKNTFNFKKHSKAENPKLVDYNFDPQVLFTNNNQ